MSEPQTYLCGNEDGEVLVQCERPECLVLAADGARWWHTEALSYRTSPEEATAAVAAHIATHTQETPS